MFWEPSRPIQDPTKFDEVNLRPFQINLGLTKKLQEARGVF